MDTIYKELFEKNNINHKENNRTNEQTNKIFFAVKEDISLLNNKRYRIDDSENSYNLESKDESINKNEKHNGIVQIIYLIN